ncbi:MAG TPA: GGDEF domain-containing protein [Spirochaetota bacterium]|nr:GGDEF domain-containing protein [Spirochaetota bacterium]HPQ54383.1 GGDEF domain-containing protein [Spirochaetota bacterium]
MNDDFYKKLIENIFDGVYYVDRGSRIAFWNKGAERITGYTASEVVGKQCSDNILRHVDDSGTELCIQGCPLRDSINDGLSREVDVYLHHREGHRVPVTVRVTPIRDEEGVVIGAVEVFSDNSRRSHVMKEMEKLREEIFIDPLTEVGNRKFADVSLSGKMEEFRSHNVPLGLLFLDIDHFKQCNDTYGHSAGDSVLVSVGRTIANVLRKLDVVCRWGGEEFIVIIPNADVNTLSLVAERIRAFVEKSWVDHNGAVLRVTVSIGGTLARDGDSIEEFVGRADRLMYESKDSGRNRVTIQA